MSLRKVLSEPLLLFHYWKSRALLERDFALEWSATNAHFVGGMLGFIFLIASRVYFYLKGGLLGRSASGLAVSSLLLMTSVVNREVANGGGSAGKGFGGTVMSLWTTYGRLLWKRATSRETFGILELSSILVFAWGLQGVLRSVFCGLKKKAGSE